MINREELERMYLVDHLSMQEIGYRLGCTRQNVYHHLGKFRIDKSTGERFNIKCDQCGSEFSITRKRYRKSIKHFHSKECYSKYMENPDFKQHRQGQRIGRAVMEESLGRRLRDGEVVHHLDGNNDNNELSNLKLFGSQSDHLKFHHEARR